MRVGLKDAQGEIEVISKSGAFFMTLISTSIFKENRA